MSVYKPRSFLPAPRVPCDGDPEKMASKVAEALVTCGAVTLEGAARDLRGPEGTLPAEFDTSLWRERKLADPSLREHLRTEIGVPEHLLDGTIDMLRRAQTPTSNAIVGANFEGKPVMVEAIDALMRGYYPLLLMLLESGMSPEELLEAQRCGKRFVAVVGNECVVEGRGTPINNIHTDAAEGRARELGEAWEAVRGGADALNRRCAAAAEEEKKVAVEEGGRAASSRRPVVRLGHVQAQFVLNPSPVDPRECNWLAVVSPHRLEEGGPIVTKGSGKVADHWVKASDAVPEAKRAHVEREVGHVYCDGVLGDVFLWAPHGDHEPGQFYLDAAHGAVAALGNPKKRGRDADRHQRPRRLAGVCGIQVVPLDLLLESEWAFRMLLRLVREWFVNIGSVHHFLAAANRGAGYENGHAVTQPVVVAVTADAALRCGLVERLQGLLETRKALRGGFVVRAVEPWGCRGTGDLLDDRCVVELTGHSRRAFASKKEDKLGELRGALADLLGASKETPRLEVEVLDEPPPLPDGRARGLTADQRSALRRLRAASAMAPREFRWRHDDGSPSLAAHQAWSDRHKAEVRDVLKRMQKEEEPPSGPLSEIESAVRFVVRAVRV